MELTDKIYYDSIQVIYYTDDRRNPQAFSMVLDYTDIETWQDLIDHIKKVDDVDEFTSMLIIAERGLDGIVVRWNNYEGLFQVGTTRGYA